ncbi:cell division protein CpoB [Erwinia sp. CPCC 100877]|nr:cell division protein CpoB [Erwinia sp. CPCC 100877]
MSSNFRQSLMTLSLLVGVAAPLGAAHAQASISSVGSGSIEDRVTQLERISNAHSQLLTQLQQQAADNQTDIAQLRGQIQESQYQLNQVVERQKQILLQIESLNGGNAGQPQGGDVAQNPGAVADTQASQGTASAEKAVQSGDANSDYNAAFTLVQEKRSDEAIAAFQNFVKKYPDSTYQPNANYWLGQLYSSKGQKDNALHYFALVVKNYPDSPKAPDAFYKVGAIMQEKGDKEKAKAVYQQVISKYPGTGAATQAQKKLSTL